jgi:uncharacterized protein (TIGR03437 family)
VAGLTPSTVAAAGELIRITGGSFGPLNPIYATVDADRMYPRTAEEFRVAIGGLDAPIIAVGRSAPGLSTGVIQINIRITADAPGSGVRALGIGIVASDTFPGLSTAVPSGVVFIK